jgi:hypothetical protein
MLTKDAILAAEDRPTQDMEVPEWGGAVRLRGLSATDQDTFNAVCFDGKGKLLVANFRAQLVARCVVDDAGARIFTDAEVELVAGKSGAVLDRIFPVCLKLSGMQDLEGVKGN